ncbi:MAG: pseudouridine-5'-phosphate glycosidase [Actinomycetia bacterium]|nr:pseudouridine-5'-phosphate glycosidase [Actinomycetes bacterium]MCH9839561.1 pseudouridine-5'-phosphate glycosidase [Actinomycetes bacterium]
MNHKSDLFSFTPEVLDALNTGAPVVALESTIISHGLPRPENMRVAAEVEDIVRSRGAVPATIAMLEGRIHVGLNESELEAVATRDDVVKTSIRDLATVAARKGFAATTVAATSHLANLVGIRVFATGGLGGVHRHARESWDESADLTALSQIPITIVCSGVKSILDVGATLERLETLNVGVVVFGSQEFPGFYLSESGFTVDWSLDDPADIADVMATRRQLDITSGLVIAHPLPHASQLDPDLHDQVLTEGLKLADSKKIAGKDVTPFLLDHFHRATHGQSLVVNTEIIVRNAELAARISVADSRDFSQA